MNEHVPSSAKLNEITSQGLLHSALEAQSFENAFEPASTWLETCANVLLEQFENKTHMILAI